MCSLKHSREVRLDVGSFYPLSSYLLVFFDWKHIFSIYNAWWILVQGIFDAGETALLFGFFSASVKRLVQLPKKESLFVFLNPSTIIFTSPPISLLLYFYLVYLLYWTVAGLFVVNFFGCKWKKLQCELLTLNSGHYPFNPISCWLFWIVWMFYAINSH